MYGVYYYSVVTRAHTHTHTRAHNLRQLALCNLWQPAPASFFDLQQDYRRHVWDIDIVDQPSHSLLYPTTPMITARVIITLSANTARNECNVSRGSIPPIHIQMQIGRGNRWL